MTSKKKIRVVAIVDYDLSEVSWRQVMGKVADIDEVLRGLPKSDPEIVHVDCELVERRGDDRPDLSRTKFSYKKVES